MTSPTSASRSPAAATPTSRRPCVTRRRATSGSPRRSASSRRTGARRSTGTPTWWCSRTRRCRRRAASSTTPTGPPGPASPPTSGRSAPLWREEGTGWVCRPGDAAGLVVVLRTAAADVDGRDAAPGELRPSAPIGSRAGRGQVRRALRGRHRSLRPGDAHRSRIRPLAGAASAASSAAAAARAATGPTALTHVAPSAAWVADGGRCPRRFGDRRGQLVVRRHLRHPLVLEVGVVRRPARVHQLHATGMPIRSASRPAPLACWTTTATSPRSRRSWVVVVGLMVHPSGSTVAIATWSALGWTHTSTGPMPDACMNPARRRASSGPTTGAANTTTSPPSPPTGSSLSIGVADDDEPLAGRAERRGYSRTSPFPGGGHG